MANEINGGNPLYTIHEAIVNSANMLFFAVDKNCRILYVNEIFKQKCGRELEIGQRMPVEILYVKFDVDNFFENIFPKVLKGAFINGEVILLDKQGVEIPLRYSAFPVRNEDGNIYAYASIGDDITKEKQKEAALQQHLRSLEFLSNFAIPFTKPNGFDELMDFALMQLEELLQTDRIYLYDIVGNNIKLTHERIRGNSFRSMMGLYFTLEDITSVSEQLKTSSYLLYNDVRKHYSENPHFDYGAKSSLYLALSIDGNWIGFINFLTVDRFASWTDAECRLAATACSIVAGAIAIHKADTALIEAKEEAQKANDAKSQFLSNVSHEIRTPLNAITGMAQILKNKASTEYPESIPNINKILSASEHLLSILNNVLDMSKIESGKFMISNESFELLGAFNDIKNIIEQQCKDKNINFVTEFNDFRNTVVKGDKLRLKQVLINLLGNAVKFTSSRGTIYFKVVTDYADESTITITFVVSDNGIGIKQELIDKLFIPFEQGEKSITGQFAGTGLGLAISQNLVEIMGGKISVKSEYQKGSEFSFTLRFETSELCPIINSKSELPMINLTGKHVLVVEDIDINREIIMTILADTNASFDEAKNGEEAFNLFMNSPIGYYDLIFMDIQMPVMNGYEATKHIRSLPRKDAGEVAIIAMTANAYTEDVYDAMKAGMDEHIAKPIDLQKVMRIISEFI